jgi:hypothetical protein
MKKLLWSLAAILLILVYAAFLPEWIVSGFHVGR